MSTHHVTVQTMGETDDNTHFDVNEHWNDSKLRMTSEARYNIVVAKEMVRAPFQPTHCRSNNVLKAK